MLPVNATKHATLPSASHCLDHLFSLGSANLAPARPRQRKYLKTETENRK